MFLPYEVRRSPPSSKEGYLQSLQRRSRSFKSLRPMRKLITFDIFARIQVIEANEFEVLIEKIFTILLKKYIKGKWKRKTARPSIILEITYNIFYDVLFNLIMLIYFRRKWLKIHVTINYFSIILNIVTRNWTYHWNPILKYNIYIYCTFPPLSKTYFKTFD